jgi:hypothetical protein
MLPIHSGSPEVADVGGSMSTSNLPTLGEYFGRMLKYTQMDFDYTFAQMVYLCFAPEKVYQLTKYRKRTKGQWARDDPAFMVIQAIFLAAAGLAYGICFGENWYHQVRTFLYFIVYHFLALGILVSGASILVAKKYLRKNTSVHGVSQDMEWLYAFDVHCNAFFPLFLLTYVVQYFGLPFLYTPASIAACITANTLHTIAVVYYFYVVYLGYNTLPFIDKAEVFMAPAILFMIVSILSTFMGINLTVVFVEWTTGVLW